MKSNKKSKKKNFYTDNFYIEQEFTNTGLTRDSIPVRLNEMGYEMGYEGELQTKPIYPVPDLPPAPTEEPVFFDDRPIEAQPVFVKPIYSPTPTEDPVQPIYPDLPPAPTEEPVFFDDRPIEAQPVFVKPIYSPIYPDLPPAPTEEPVFFDDRPIEAQPVFVKPIYSPTPTEDPVQPIYPDLPPAPTEEQFFPEPVLSTHPADQIFLKSQSQNCGLYQNQSGADWLGDYQMCDGTWQYGGIISSGAQVCIVMGTAFTLSGMDLVPLYPCGTEAQQPIQQLQPVFIDDIIQPIVPIVPQPIYEQPVPQPIYEQPVPQPIYEQPVPQPIYEQPVPQPIYEQPVPQPIYEPIYEQPVPPIYEQPIYEPVPQPIYEQPVPQPVHPVDELFMPKPPVSLPVEEPKIESAQPVPTPSAPSSLPTKPIGKNLTPYVYAGLGIIVILVVARMITKK